ncbi:MAG: hypothetical protein ACO23K_03565 [Ilumatobacteraceae bacterium]
MTHKLNQIAALFRKGSDYQADAAVRLKKTVRNRATAKTALMPAFARAYGAPINETKTGKLVWVKGDKKAKAAKTALNRLLALAYGTKPAAAKRPSSKVERIIKMLDSLTAAQRRRVAAACK